MLILAAFSWLVLVCAGMKFVLDYQTRAGDPARPPGRWPRDSRIAAAAGRPTLLMFVHPRCPCSRATLSELERVLARAGGGLEATVQFVVPAGENPAWADGELWRRASAIPGARVAADSGGAEARRFHSATSGQVLVYDESGRLRFAGGITAGRGHAGDNAGSDAVAALAQRGTASRMRTPVYGCELASPSTTDEGRNPECPR